MRNIGKTDVKFLKSLKNLDSDTLRAEKNTIEQELLTRQAKEKHIVKAESVNTITSRLLDIGITPHCPNSGDTNHGSSIKYIRRGYYKGMSRYYCPVCHKVFSLTTGTLFDGSTYNWEIWLEIVHSLLNDLSATQTMTALNAKFANYQTGTKVIIDSATGIRRSIPVYGEFSLSTVWRCMMKLCTAFAMGYTSPELSGTVEIDETFFRENQKNTHDEKKLLDYSHNLQNRPARSGVLCGLATPPAYGTTSPEYITVVTAIDEHKHIVITPVGFGGITLPDFMALIQPNLKNATYICSDANIVYSDYCNSAGVPHFIKGSYYDKTVKDMANAAIDAARTNNLPFSASLCLLDAEKQVYNQSKTFGPGSRMFVEGRNFSWDELNKEINMHHLTLENVNKLHSRLKTLFSKYGGTSNKYLSVRLKTYEMSYNIKTDLGKAEETLDPRTGITSSRFIRAKEIPYDKCEELFRQALITAYGLRIKDMATSAANVRYTNKLGWNAIRQRIVEYRSKTGCVPDNEQLILTDEEIRTAMLSVNTTTFNRICKHLGLSIHINKGTNRDCYISEICKQSDVSYIIWDDIGRASLYSKDIANENLRNGGYTSIKVVG